MTVLPVAVLLALLMVLPVSQARPETGAAGVLEATLALSARGEWEAADRMAARAGDPLVADIALWTRLRNGAGYWDEYIAFLKTHADWPGLSSVRRAGEREMPGALAPDEVIAYFDVQPPRTGLGVLRLAAARAAMGAREAAEALVVETWRTRVLIPSDRAALRAAWEPVLKAHHRDRLDMLLWEGEREAAAEMLPLVDQAYRLLALARMAVRADEDGLMLRIAAVPEALRGDPGLAFERYLYRTKRGRWEEAEAYLHANTATAEALGRPDKWMPRRANLARQALRRGQTQRAYEIAALNFGSGERGHSDSEWLAGYIALEYLDDPGRAAQHFERFADLVTTPISLGRAGYWLGRAQAAAGDGDAAAQAYAMGALHQTSFYGQLAALEAGVPLSGALAGTRAVPDWRAAGLAETPLARAARLFVAAGYESRASQFLRHMADDAPAERRAMIAQMAVDTDLPHVAVRMMKEAARDGIVLPTQYYPLDPMVLRRWPVPTEFALAIARQESELNPAARSHVGALGLMQLMPATAQEVAAGADLPFLPAQLTLDADYNTRLGTAYLARLLRAYDGSLLLAAAAYNAGPGRVAAWLEEFGDPRAPGADPVRWIESIPFSETRNYVMRVLEGAFVYRARLDGAPVASHPIGAGAGSTG